MDTDALSDFVFGELYVPLEIAGGAPKFVRTWSFAPTMADAVRQYALDFAKPFWAEFDVQGNIRTTRVEGLDMTDGSPSATLTETLLEATHDGYRYAVSPIFGVTQTGQFSLNVEDNQTKLTWACTYTASDDVYLARWMAVLADAADVMQEKLATQFAPKS
jgi:hypothetical protein